MFDDMTFAVNPLWLDRIQPGTFGGQKEGQDVNALARLLDLRVLFSDPGAYHVRAMPGGVLPNQQPVAFALLVEALTAPVEKCDGDPTFSAPSHKAHPHLGAIRLVRGSFLPQHSRRKRGLWDRDRLSAQPARSTAPEDLCFATRQDT